MLVQYFKWLLLCIKYIESSYICRCLELLVLLEYQPWVIQYNNGQHVTHPWQQFGWAWLRIVIVNLNVSSLGYDALTQAQWSWTNCVGNRSLNVSSDMNVLHNAMLLAYTVLRVFNLILFYLFRCSIISTRALRWCYIAQLNFVFISKEVN